MTSRSAARGPAELGARLGEVRAWAAGWAKAASGPLRVEYKQVGGRIVGTNTIPARAWLDGYDQAWDLLGTRDDVRRFADLAERTKAEAPRLARWLERRPVKALELADAWESCSPPSAGSTSTRHPACTCAR